ncbi:hypothetical protein ACJJTC_011079 [Scirpophaga incertulas]
MIADCTSPLVTGHCKGGFPRYGFNTKTGKCQKFTYGGCGGNGNNYKTLKECKETCEPATDSTPNQGSARNSSTEAVKATETDTGLWQTVAANVLVFDDGNDLGTL